MTMLGFYANSTQKNSLHDSSDIRSKALRQPLQPRAAALVAAAASRTTRCPKLPTVCRPSPQKPFEHWARR